MFVKPANIKAVARMASDNSLKPRNKVCREERIAALLKSWPELEQMEVRRVSKHDCLGWAAKFGETASPSNFNNTVGTLRTVVDIAVEAGARYDNPARGSSKNYGRCIGLIERCKTFYRHDVSRILKREGLNKLSKAQQAKFDAVSGEAICAHPPKSRAATFARKMAKAVNKFSFSFAGNFLSCMAVKKTGQFVRETKLKYLCH